MYLLNNEKTRNVESKKRGKKQLPKAKILKNTSSMNVISGGAKTTKTELTLGIG